MRNGSDGSERSGIIGKILPFPIGVNALVPELKELLRDEDVAEFFKYVHNNDLRAEALELLEKRLGESE